MLQLKNISKNFPGIRALHKINLEILGGEVHAICGENGAGKSTLLNILAGTLKPDEGSIFVLGKECHLPGVQHSQKMGIGIVHQENSLVEGLTVAENILASNIPCNRFGLITFRKMYQLARDLLAQLSVTSFNDKTYVKDLSAGQKQMVEIAKALFLQPSILLLDEPTAAITEQDKENLFALIRILKSKGVTIIYISHRMAEIKTIADRISILKDGELQGTYEAEAITIDEVITKMVGRRLLGKQYPSHTIRETVLQVNNLSGHGFREVTFSLNKGEIFGFAGLVGSGRTELALTLFGASKKNCGIVLKNGQPININQPGKAIQNGITYLSEERKTLGIFPDLSVADNMVVANLKSVANNNIINHKQLVWTFKKYQQKLSIKAMDAQQPIRHLSGGNQQKIVLSRCLLSEPDVFIADEPTQGVDIGAKLEIYDLFKEMTRRGISIILISSELPELLLLADRIGVMYEGRLQTIMSREQATEENIMHYAAGNQ